MVLCFNNSHHLLHIFPPIMINKKKCLPQSNSNISSHRAVARPEEIVQEFIWHKEPVTLFYPVFHPGISPPYILSTPHPTLFFHRMDTKHTVILHLHPHKPLSLFPGNSHVTDVSCSLAVLQGDSKARGGWIGVGEEGQNYLDFVAPFLPSQFQPRFQAST